MQYSEVRMGRKNAASRLFSSPVAAASPSETQHSNGTIVFPPRIATDIPCLEGSQFLVTGGESFRSTLLISDGFAHVTSSEKSFATAVPVDGQGPTYVEAPNAADTIFTLRASAPGDETVFTTVNNDRFIGYLNGQPVGSATIRVHQIEHFVALDTDGDGVPDSFKVSVSISDFSCP
jgi:hypothetical protein